MKYLVANWKNYLTVKQEKELLNKIGLINNFSDQLEIILCPSFLSLFNNKLGNFKLASQDVSPFENGAYTGEISALNLKEIGCNYALIGHSERRILFQEKDKLLKQKINQVVQAGLIPIFCCGEKEANLSIEETKNVLKKQLKMIDSIKNKPCLIAYEPVWAIGGQTALNFNQAEIIHQEIKKIIGRLDIPVLYGGAVNENNIEDFLKQPNIDGLLIGRASLDFEKFSYFIKLKV